jgi:hypothetical protein
MSESTISRRGNMTLQQGAAGDPKRWAALDSRNERLVTASDTAAADAERDGADRRELRAS